MRRASEGREVQQSMNPEAHEVVEFLVYCIAAVAAVFIVWPTVGKIRKYQRFKRFKSDLVRDYLVPGKPALPETIEALLEIAREDNAEGLALAKMARVRERFGHDGVTMGHLWWIFRCICGSKDAADEPPDFRGDNACIGEPSSMSLDA